MKQLSKKQRNALYKKALNHFKIKNIATAEYLCFLFRDMIFGDAWVKGVYYSLNLSQQILDEFNCFVEWDSESWNFDTNEDRVFVLAMLIEMSK